MKDKETLAHFAKIKDKEKFAHYAQMLNSVVGGTETEFTINLLSAGLYAQGRSIINDCTHDRIQKYWRGERGVSRLAPEIKNYFNHFILIDDLDEMINESQYPIICKKLMKEPFLITTGESDVLATLAEIHEHIFKFSDNSEIELPYDNNTNITIKDIIDTYTLKDDEKSAIIRICGILKRNLEKLNKITIAVWSQQEIINNDDNEKEWRDNVEKLLVESLNNYEVRYDEVKATYEKLLKVLNSKRLIHECIDKLCSIGEEIISEKHIVRSSTFDKTVFQDMIKDFNTNYKTLAEKIDSF